MDFKKFGWSLVLLSSALAIVAGYYSLIPYINRWSDFEVIAEATKAGYATGDYIAMKAARAVDAQRVFVFGWAAAIGAFLGASLIASSNKSSSTNTPAPITGSEKTYWVCGKCNETTEIAKNTCWSCGASKV